MSIRSNIACISYLIEPSLLNIFGEIAFIHIIGLRFDYLPLWVIWNFDQYKLTRMNT